MPTIFPGRGKLISLSRLLRCAMLLASSQLVSWGQSTFGSFVGTVKDPAGAAIPAVVVSLTNKGTSAKRDTVTDADGNYQFLNLEPGMYDIMFQAAGFRKASV